MIGAGTVINPILKIITTVVILAAVGFFIVKPVLDTTEKISDDVSDNVRNATAQSQQVFSDSQVDATRNSIASYITSVASSWPAAARAIRTCARQAGRDGIKLQRCEQFAQRIAHGMLSDRNFATSYATSLRAQGKTAEADRVDACVKDAGFEPRAMKRCRALADELLFG